jgi:hypothetical protein
MAVILDITSSFRASVSRYTDQIVRETIEVKLHSSVKSLKPPNCSLEK